jgi:glycosyltransferase involved in cell wall biosynthesis
MRILFSSHVFAPSIGGLETVSRGLAEEFVRQGHEVRLITQTPAGPKQSPGGDSKFPFQVWRRPSMATLLSLVRWCELFFHNNISLPRSWPLLLIRRPWVVAHHVWIPTSTTAGRAKRYALRFASGISVSGAIAGHLSTPSVIIPNPYDDSTFRRLHDVERTKDLIFLGRLVSDKGADLLLRAMSGLRARDLSPSLTIVGRGPEEEKLRARTSELELTRNVDFVGLVSGQALCRLLNEHRILVVPSLWNEPFGVVALEGIACGCVVVGSGGGGLQEAIGPCGETFPNGNALALTDTLETLLRRPDRIEALLGHAEQHLERHRLARVAQDYLAVLSGRISASSSERAVRCQP